MKHRILTVWAILLALSLFLGNCSNDSITSSSSSIRVTEPASYSAVTAGMTSDIQWTVTGKADNTVAIDLYADTGFVQSIGASVPNNGDFSWLVSSLAPGDSAYRIKVTSGSQASVFGFSSTFTVINNTDGYEPDNTPSQATSIDTSGIPQRHRISQPDTDWFKFDATGGVTYCIQTHGNAETCLWLYATNAITLLSSDNSGSGSGNNGLIVWTCGVSSGTYYFKVTAPYQTGGEDYTVDIRSGGAILAITSPVSGVNGLTGGSTLPIAWAHSVNTGTSVSLYVYRSDTLAGTIVLSTSNNGYYTWTVPWSMPSSSSYRIRIVSDNDTSIHDLSDQFTVTHIPSTLTITSPTLSTRWSTGSQYSIYWTYSGNFGPYVRVDLYDSTALVSTVSSSWNVQYSPCNWTVPSSLGTSSAYRIKVTGTTDTFVYDFSDTFTITHIPTTLAITTPSTGTSWNSGSPYTVYWTYTGNPGSYVTLSLYDSTQFVSSMVSSTYLSDRSCQWTVPLSLATSSRYRIKIASTADSSVYGFSTPFTIVHTPNALTLTVPSAATKWNSGSSYSVYWTYTGNPGTYVTLALYDSAGLVSAFSQTYLLSSQTCSWAIPLTVPTSPAYRLKITSVSDTSVYGFSSAFTITKIPSALTLTTPSATTNWNTGTPYTIYWTYTGNPGTSVKLSLWDSTSSSLVSTITSATSATSGAYSWTPPPTIASGNYRVRISSVQDTTIYGYSSIFKITNVPTTIIVNEPADTTSWDIGTSQWIVWSHTGTSLGDYATLDLYNDQAFVSTLTTSGPMTLCAYYWQVPLTLPGGTRYRIKISSNAYPSISAFSPYFTIVQIPGRLTIATPTTATSWNTGTSYSISWTYAGATGSTVKLDLYDSSSFVQAISPGVSTTSGALSWLVPSSLHTGGRYQIRITSTTQDTIFNLSSFFTITYVPATITVTAPVTNDTIFVPASKYIYWTYSGPVPGSYVSVSLVDSLGAISAIASSVYRTNGYFTWSLPSTQAGGTKLRVRVCSTTDTTVAGYSGFFTIVPLPPRLTITAPDTLTTWTGGYNYTIYWSYSGSPGPNVKIDLYDSTALVQSISQSVYTSDGNLLWSVPSSLPTDARYRVKIASTTQDSVFVYSRYFRIANPSMSDSYEPDSTSALAKPIAVGGVAQNHSLSTNDKDWLTFAATAGTSYTIQTFGSLDTYLNLFSTDATAVLASDDDQPNGDTNAKITWTCTVSGTYYFEIFGVSGSVGNYTVSVQ